MFFDFSGNGFILAGASPFPVWTYTGLPRIATGTQNSTVETISITGSSSTAISTTGIIDDQEN